MLMAVLAVSTFVAQYESVTGKPLSQQSAMLTPVTDSSGLCTTSCLTIAGGL
jgi:hypothetical protein